MNSLTERIPAYRHRSEPLDVIVAGGGMAGAAAALALARSGLTVTVVEARELPPWHAGDEVDLRVVALAPSSARLLNELGVWETLLARRASAYRHMHVWDAGNSASLDFDAADLQRESLGWIVENRLVQQTLWEAMDAAGVQRRCPARITHHDADHEGVRVVLDDESILHTRLLVAADGASSPLRQRAGIGTYGHEYAQRGVVAHVRTERDHDATAWQRFLPDGPIALLPLVDGRCSIVWTLPEVRAREVLALSDEDFCHQVGVATDFRLGPIQQSSARAGFPLRLQLAERYQAQRMVLLGDAAHVVHPLAGQGVNLGLRDVVQLRDTLSAARTAGRDLGAESVLRRYARRRRSADTLDAYAFNMLQRTFAQHPFSLISLLRGAGIRALDRVPVLKNIFARHAAGI